MRLLSKTIAAAAALTVDAAGASAAERLSTLMDGFVLAWDRG